MQQPGLDQPPPRYSTTPVYRSSNGDRWDLVLDTEGMRVHHQPNAASGGQSSLTNLSAFLSEGHGPQHEALLRLLNDVGYLAP
jgi:hypothetical protein